jgi:hypothetical protein
MTAEWIGRRETDRSPIIYYSGVSNVDEDAFHARVPFTHRCVSFAFLGAPKGPRQQFKTLDFCQRHGVRIFLDSGAHTFHNLIYGRNWANRQTKHTSKAIVEKRLDEYLHAYAARIAEIRKTGLLDFYATVDYEQDCQVIYNVTQRLYKLGVQPMPVYHGDDSISWLRRYIDEGHRLIGVSWTEVTEGKVRRRRYYDHVFNVAAKYGVALHGFAMTGGDMFSWPWHSVDSATWLKAAAYGKVMDVVHHAYSRPTIREVAVSDQKVTWDATTRRQWSYLSEQVKAAGIRFQDVRSSRAARALYNLHVFESVSRRYTTKKEMRWKTLL